MVEHAQAFDLQRLEVGRRAARQVHAETLPGHGVAVLESGVADRLLADPGPLRDQLRGEGGVHAALLDRQQQVFARPARSEGVDLLDEEVLGGGADGRRQHRVSVGSGQ